MTSDHERTAGGETGAPSSLLPFDPTELTSLRVTQAELARMFGVSRQAVSQWVKKGILSFGPDGRIDPRYAASQVLKKTDPGRLRAKLLKSTSDNETALRKRVAELEAQLEGADDAPDKGDTGDYHKARARTEHFKSLAAEREYRKSMGELLRADEVCDAVSSAATALRVRLEALPAVLGPMLAPVQSEDEVTAILAKEIERALTELATKFKAVAGGQL